MPSIVDVMTLPIDQCPTFVPNNAVDAVVMTIPAGFTNRFANYSKNTFTKGDSFQLLSAGIIMPECFTSWRALLSPPLSSLSLKAVGVVSGADYTNPNFPLAQTFLPMENYETVFDTFYDCSASYRGGNPLLTLRLENFYIVGNIIAQAVSMLGVPGAFNGKTMYMVPFIKVLHTIPLS
jgi:hypothetical protein